MATKQIRSSVGKGGVNIPEDVGIVQTLLKSKEIYEGDINKICDLETISAIKYFQSHFMEQPNGRIDPNSYTWEKLTGQLPMGESLLSRITKIELFRILETSRATIGELYFDNSLKGYVLEPPGPDSMAYNSGRRVPTGSYKLRWQPISNSRWVNTVPLLYNNDVPAERGILISGGLYPNGTKKNLIVGTLQSKQTWICDLEMTETLPHIIDFLYLDPQIHEEENNMVKSSPRSYPYPADNSFRMLSTLVHYIYQKNIANVRLVISSSRNFD